jgi:hypothetical protein
MARCRDLLPAALLLGSVAGCGGPKLYPVSGQIAWQDGSPAKELAGGLLALESVGVRASARSDIEADGSFRVTTTRPGDGAYEGRYRVLIDVPRLSDRELNMGKREPRPILDPRYGQADGSVSLILADLPYPRQYLGLYADLAGQAARLLREGGSLVLYCPTYLVHDVLTRVTPHVPFWNLICLKHSGAASRLNFLRVTCRGKTLVHCVRGTYRGQWHCNFIQGDVPLKLAHDWAQGEGEASYVISKMSEPGELVLDPACGSGTSLLAAWKLGRRALGLEIDRKTAMLARSRLATETAGH